eukprot:CAMPEP_0196573486 /NCGR_PEP_ID=MMETSP1081-20130531/3390_1 /TAXON_ID=36882 /ORGANISM="Pyramimonas amylifera, Strain CCMP720" /LENGTH=269 /DNA_ID=CAMNT_0041891221 /DNA_START=42 /DNA_END=851 /DNA_ORIENTATION=-
MSTALTYHSKVFQMHCVKTRYSSSTLAKLCPSSNNARNIAFTAAPRSYSSKPKRFAIKASVETSPMYSAVNDLDKIPALKLSLLRAVASLDRGVAASKSDMTRVDDLVSQLESAIAVATPDSRSIDQRCDGLWRLVYTSNISDQPTSVGPFKLGQVFQRISCADKTLDNVVELMTPNFFALPSTTISAALQHSLNASGTNTLEITFEGVSIDASNVIQGVELPGLPSLPEALRPPSNLRTGSFDVTFVDDEMRVSRGERGELRVFMKES